MRAVVLDYRRRKLELRELAEPKLESDSQVLFRVHEVGVCGTDRELAKFRFEYPPPGDDFLVLGHEALGQVMETGPGVKDFRPGDWVTPMVRRACRPPCASCARGRRDLCLSGALHERGIFRLHGYFADYAVDEAEDLVRVPASLADRAVLMEPLSTVEKAVDLALRLHEPGVEIALVLGAGPVGILAALVLRLRGLSVSLHSLEPADHPRADLIRDAGIEYLPRMTDCQADVIIEATGSPEAALQGLRRLAPLGVYVVLGGIDARGEMPFRDLVLKNQIIVGSVNASPRSFSLAIQDLARFDRTVVERMIRRVGFADFERTILGPQSDTPKVVLVLAE